MIDFAGLGPPRPPVEAETAETVGRDAVDAEGGADVLTTLHATVVLVVVLEEAVAAAEVTVCCG